MLAEVVRTLAVKHFKLIIEPPRLESPSQIDPHPLLLPLLPRLLHLPQPRLHLLPPQSPDLDFCKRVLLIATDESLDPPPDDILQQKGEVVMLVVPPRLIEELRGQVEQKLIEYLIDLPDIVLELLGELADAVEVGPLCAVADDLAAPPLADESRDLAPQLVDLAPHWLGLPPAFLGQRGGLHPRQPLLLREKDSFYAGELAFVLAAQIQIPLSHLNLKNNCLTPQQSAFSARGRSPIREQLFIAIIRRMKQQSDRPNCEFVIEKECPRGPIYNSTSYRIVDLQNKLTFYEGQLDPLQLENETLKDSLLRLSHLVSFNTGILRKLLLVEGHPARRLKLEMATFEEITQDIDEHCREMERSIAKLTKMNRSLEEEREELHRQLQGQKDERQKDLKLFQSELASLTNKYQGKIRVLDQQLQALQSQYQTMKCSLSQQLQSHKSTIEKYIKEMHIQRTEFGFRERQLKTCAERLRSTIQASSLEYEQGRKSLKALYEKMINDRLAEQGETYELMLKHKEEEKHRIYVMIDELKQAQLRLSKERQEQRQKLGRSILAERETIKQLQNELYEMKEMMKRKGMEEKEVFRQLIILKENCQILDNNCRKYEANIEKLMAQHKNQATLLQSKISGLEKQLSDLIEEKEKEKRQFLKIISEKQAIISTQQVKLEDIDSTVKLQIRQFKAQSELKQQQLYAAIEEKEQKFKEERGRYQSLEREMERDLALLKQRHKQSMKKLEKEHSKKREEMMKENYNKLQKIQEQRDDEIIKVKLENNQQIQALKKQFQQAREKIKVQQVESNKQQMLDFSRERRQHKEQIQVLQNTILDLNEEVGKLKKGMIAAEDKMEKLKAQQLKEIIKLDNKNSELNAKWQAMYDKQMSEFQQSFEEASRDFGDRQSKLYEQIQKLTIKLECHQEQKAQLRKEMQSQVKQLKTKAGFDKIENRMREQISSKVHYYQNKEKEIKRYYEERISSSSLSHHNEKQQLLLFYNKEIYDIKEKSAQILLSIIKTTFEVEPSLAEDHPYDFSASEEEKGVLIQRCIRSLGTTIYNKNSQISQMREHLLVFQKSIEAELQQRKDQIEKQRQQFLQKQAQQHAKALRLLEEQAYSLQHDYQAKKIQLEKDSKQFSELLYEEFNLLSSTHEKEYRKLFRRYDELQRIHQTRPSRAGDITRIKQLQSMVKRLSLEAENSKKKIQYANQIMKYMNMQLQNYKETYDVFGPTGDASINSTFSFNSDQKMLKVKRSLLRKMKDDYVSNLSKNAKLEVKVTPFFEERKEQKSMYAYQATLLQHSRINSDQIINKNRKYSEENEDQKESESLQSKQSQRKRSMQRNRRILKTEQKLAGKQTKVLQSSQSLLQVLSSKNSKLVNTNDRSLGLTRKLSFRKKKIKRLSTEIEHLD